VISDFGSYQVRPGRLSSHVVSGHFGFQVILGQIRLVIGSCSIGSFRVVLGQVGLVIGSSSVKLFWILNHIGLDQIGSDHISPSMCLI
jgi:hypothetical protein